MKKVAILCAGLAVVLMASSAFAQIATTNTGLAVWYDTRNDTATDVGGLNQDITVSPTAPFTLGQSVLTKNVAGTKTFSEDVAAGNSGGPGDADVLRISPRLPPNTDIGFFPLGLHFTGKTKAKATDQSIKNLYVYMTVEDRANPGPDVLEAISALGRETVIDRTGAPNAGNTIESLSITLDAAPWSLAGTSSSIDTALAPDTYTVSTKMVNVPVDIVPSFDPGGQSGVVPGPGVVFPLATITVTAAPYILSSKVVNSTYTVTDSVNNLLITRAYDGAGPTPEEPDFGYTVVEIPPLSGLFFTAGGNGIPEAATVNSVGPPDFGSHEGTTSATADAIIEVRLRGDFTNNGVTNAADAFNFNNAVLLGLGNRQRGMYLADFTNNGIVSAADAQFFNFMVFDSSAGCPCP